MEKASRGLYQTLLKKSIAAHGGKASLMEIDNPHEMRLDAAMKTSIRSLALLLFFFSCSVFAGAPPIISIVLPANAPQVKVNVPNGKIVTVLTFTSDGSTAAGGTQATVQVEQNFGITATFSTVMHAYDPSNVNDMPHSAVVAQAPASTVAPSTMSVNFNAAQNVTTFITYSITNN